MVMERVEEEDTGEPSPSTQCTNHPHQNSTPGGGGICALCLQEKLGKLVCSSSSSFPVPVFPSNSSSPSPNSFRSDFNAPKSTLSASSIDPVHITHHLNSSTNCQHNQYHYSRAFLRIPFVRTQKRKKNKDRASLVFNRSKSVTTPRRGGSFLAAAEDEYTPRKRGLFASLLYLSKNSITRKGDSKHCHDEIDVFSNGSVSMKKREGFAAVVEMNESPETETFDRKVSRSRSVGCGSRSFSGDFFERISTGFGDCTLRRVESQREAKQKISSAHRRRDAAAVSGGGGRHYIKERVKCSGIFSGLMATSSSSSSSSSYLVSSSAEDSRDAAAKTTTAVVRHGRSKSWGWAFASPLRAFNKKREGSNKKITPPNLNAIPSLLVLRG